MEIVTSCHATTSLAYAAWHRVVGSFRTVAAQLPRVVEPPCTVAVHREWVAGLRCTVAVLQSHCSHILLVFNVLSAARLADAWCLGRYAHAPMEDHGGYVVRGYLFTSIAPTPYGSLGHVAALEIP
jgi:hypothetical protein